MKNMAAHPRVVDASGKPQPFFGSDDGMQFVDVEPYEEANVVDATDGSGHNDDGGEDDGVTVVQRMKKIMMKKIKSFRSTRKCFSLI